MPDLPKEAVEAAAKAAYDDAVADVEDFQGPEDGVEGVWEAESDGYKRLFRSKAEIHLKAAAPAIREDERSAVVGQIVDSWAEGDDLCPPLAETLADIRKQERERIKRRFDQDSQIASWVKDRLDKILKEDGND